MTIRRTILPSSLLLVALACVPVLGQSPKQPRVANGPSEPDWVAILGAFYDLSMFGDLLNPVTTTAEATPGLFRKAGPGPVSYMPVIALGLETTNRGGWYAPGAGVPKGIELWNYTFKNTGEDLEEGKNLPARLGPRATTKFDPGDAPFGLWVSNDGMKDGGVFTEPAVVATVNQRLKAQPYKAMIYPYRDKATGKVVPNSYLIGWEYSTNDDFQDVVCRVDNVVMLVP
jgi:hypothetical protein